MRRLTNLPRDDRGVGTIFVILAMVALIVGAAFATDVGRYVLEARRAQNSADATVLAVATDCALGEGLLGSYATYLRDGQSTTVPYCGSYQTSITVTKPIEDGILLQQSEGEVDRSATARWGTLSTATTVPITISDCEFNAALLEGTADITLYLDDTKPQSGCSSLPGGFSQLLSGDCSVEVSAAGTVPGDPGADLQKQILCITNTTAPALPHDILIPMYDADACLAAGCTGKGPYPIVGFGAFRVTGYSFNGNNYDGTLGKKCPDEARGKYCLRGDFVEFTTSQGTPGPSTDFGTYNVYLSS